MHNVVSGREEELSEGGEIHKREKKARTQKTRPFVNQSKQGFNLMLWLGALCFADGLKMSM